MWNTRQRQRQHHAEMCRTSPPRLIAEDDEFINNEDFTVETQNDPSDDDLSDEEDDPHDNSLLPQAAASKGYRDPSSTS